MGSWQNTCYVQHDDAEVVAEALTTLLSEEGMRRVARPSPRKPQDYDPMQYAGALENNLWAAAVFRGSPGWVVIKTLPLELLGERAAGAECMRHVELCRRLGAAGRDSDGLVLVEIGPRGDYLLSGFQLLNEDPFTFHGEQLSEDRIYVRFELLPLQRLIDKCTNQGADFPLLNYDSFVDELASELGGENAAWCDNLICVDTLLPHKPLGLRNGYELYFEWPKR